MGVGFVQDWSSYSIIYTSNQYDEWRCIFSPKLDNHLFISYRYKSLFKKDLDPPI